MNLHKIIIHYSQLEFLHPMQQMNVGSKCGSITKHTLHDQMFKRPISKQIQQEHMLLKESL